MAMLNNQRVTWENMKNKVGIAWENIRTKHIPSGYLLHSHGKSPFLIGKPSISGPSIPWLC